MLDGGPGLLDSEASGDVFSLWDGSRVVANGAPNRGRESGEPRLPALSCKTPNLYSQHLLGGPPLHLRAPGRQH